MVVARILRATLEFVHISSIFIVEV